MATSELFQTYLNRLEEARLYVEQGLGEGAGEILREILDDLEKSDLAEDEKQTLRSKIEPEYRKVSAGAQETEQVLALQSIEDSPAFSEPSQTFEYALALMDGQFWHEAIIQFKLAAAVGFKVMQCWELCGDCACKLEKWDEAIRYYENIYADPDAGEDLKKQILIKITKCSQTQKKIDVESSLQAKTVAAKDRKKQPAPEPQPAKVEFVATSVTSIDQFSVNQLVGQTVKSWKSKTGGYLSERERSYRVVNLLNIGMSSVVLELEETESGGKFAGQILAGSFGESVAAEALANWARAQMMTNSVHLVRVADLALSDDNHIMVVREHVPVSLVDVLSKCELMPLSIALNLAYQVLEALGDLHLHMGRDEQIRNIFHLDLRPSRVLLYADRPLVRMYNGGLWRELEKANPKQTSVKQLPLPLLAYRAPEQFRTYLSRKKPPVFTDIYLFGALFYEMLTGSPAFKAASFEEYEIQHCEQYPTPPKVWRPEIPEELNEMIMKCLDCDPMRRWRSATQISLMMEKSFSEHVDKRRDDAYVKYLEGLKDS